MALKRQTINFLIKLLLVSVCVNSFGQSEADADSLLSRASDFIYSEPKLSEKIAKMVYENNTVSEKKIEALFILSRIDYLNANYKSSLTNLYTIENLIKSSGKSNFWNIKLNYFLSEIYYDLQIFNLAEERFTLANQEFKNMRDKGQELTRIFNYENALYNSRQKDFKESNSFFLKNLNEFPGTDLNMKYLTCLGLAGNYIHTNQLDSAELCLARILPEKKILYARSELARAKIALLKNDIKALEQHLNTSLKFSPDVKTQKNSYNLFSQEYLSAGNIEKHTFYKQKVDSVDNRMGQNLNSAKNYVIKHIEEQGMISTNAGDPYWKRTVFIIIGIVILFFIPAVYYYLKTKSDYKKFQEVINEIAVKEKLQSQENTKEKQTTIPEKSEQLLLKKLEKFERSEGYLNGKISLTTLARQLDTNTKYLSEVINMNKGKNFNSYINELRINYILKKLKTEPKYSNYKITSLAEECGYASHSTFITAFRTATGISPALFINFLKREKNQ